MKQAGGFPDFELPCVTEENHPEGLISPDAFNGKSLLSDFIKEGDSNV